MFFDDRSHVFGRHLRVKGALGVDDHNGTERAKSEAARFNDEYVVKVCFFERRFQFRDHFHGMGRSTARSAADEYLFAVTRLFCEFFALFPYDAAYFNERFFFLFDFV